MKTSLKCVGIMLSLVLTNTSLAEPYLGRLAPYVTVPTTIDTQVQVMAFTPEIRSLTDQLSENLEKNADWFEQYTKQLTPGDRVPYHPNMGLTESQYQQLLGGEDQKRLTRSGDAQITFSWREDDMLKISGLPDAAPLDTLMYESVSDTLFTSFGLISNSVPAKGKIGEDNTLSWQGRVWSTKREDENSEVSVVYVIGDLAQSNRGVLIHEVKGVVKGQVVEHHYMLMWNK